MNSLPVASVSFLQMTLIGTVICAFFGIMGLALVYIERKVAAFMQLRMGPMRVGYRGTLQTIADAVKLLSKEGLTPASADKFLFNLAPFVMIIVSMLALAPLPFSPQMQIWNINLGLFYLVAVSSLSVISILIAGWASNNKYSLVGAMRAGAQMVSYELSLGLCLVGMATLFGTLELSAIVESQQNGWWIFKGHIPALVAFVIFIIAGTAELNRTPFDLPEAESELTAGFHTEYSGMKFALFFLAEYINMFIISAIAATVFLGGWMPLHIGSWEAFNSVMNLIPPWFWFLGKTFFVIFLIMWFRWTFPRLRIDQLLTLEWKYLLPVSLVNLVILALISLNSWHF